MAFARIELHLDDAMTIQAKEPESDAPQTYVAISVFYHTQEIGSAILELAYF